MAEQRLIDANTFAEAWNQDSQIGKTMRAVIAEQPTIDPETIPLVRQLREELAREKRLCDDLQKVIAITANERDAALDRVRHYAGCWECKTREEGNCAMPFCKDGCSGWEWRGPQKEG